MKVILNSGSYPVMMGYYAGKYDKYLHYKKTNKTIEITEQEIEIDFSITPNHAIPNELNNINQSLEKRHPGTNNFYCIIITKEMVKENLTEAVKTLEKLTGKKVMLKEFNGDTTYDKYYQNKHYQDLFKHLKFAASLAAVVKEDTNLTGLHKEDILEQINKLWGTLFSETLTTH